MPKPEWRDRNAGDEVAGLARRTEAGPGQFQHANLVWAPPIGAGDNAVVFRKSIDDRCRAASRAFMATGSMLDAR